MSLRVWKWRTIQMKYRGAPVRHRAARVAGSLSPALCVLASQSLSRDMMPLPG